jgi:hypothetical protein
VTDISRLTRLLPLACLVAAICLFASHFMTMFEFTPPGGEALDTQSASDQHGVVIPVLAVLAIVALAVALLTASKPAALAVAIAGVIALLVFLLFDLPDANAVGTLDDARQSFFDAEAVPQGGFWLELVGALALAVTGIALATLTPEQLTALGPPNRKRPGESSSGELEPKVAAGHAVAHQDAKAEGALRRLTRRPRTRQRG